MPIPHLSAPARGATLAVMSILLAGCGGGAVAQGPTADQAAHSLETQVYKFLFATTTTDSKVTDALRDAYVPCGNNEGTVKLTYAVTGTPASRAATDSGTIETASSKALAPRVIIDDLLKYQPQVGTFTVTKSDDATVKLVNAKTRTHLILHSPAPGKLTISGETDCLRKGKALH